MTQPIRVAFPGVHGAFSEDAVHRHFGTEVTALAARAVTPALAALRDGRAEYCVLPIENSIAGPLYDVQRAIAGAPWVDVAGELTLPIHQCLLSGGEGLADIERVFSHPAALAQCRRFLEQRAWLRPVKRRDTASAARLVARRAGSRYGAIASARAATLFGLTVIATDVQDRPDNETRFVVLSRRQLAGRECFAALEAKTRTPSLHRETPPIPDRR